jgi:putative ABC transport system permease protein
MDANDSRPQLCVRTVSNGDRFLILRQGTWLICAGVMVGLAGAFAVTRWVKSFLYEVSATDPFTLMTVTLLLSGVALLACWIPAQRSTKVDPIFVLRCE